MALYPIVFYPDERLRLETQEITTFDADLHQLLDDMFETMYHNQGVGLAAPQIGISKKVAVIDVSRDNNEPLVLINPKIIASEGKTTYLEGCLSVPGSYDRVKRSDTVTMEAQDKDGKFYTLEASGLLGEAIQHEIDHLNGKLYIDLLSSFKCERAKKKLEKHKRMLKKKTK